jgi:hypothetical protein
MDRLVFCPMCGLRTPVPGVRCERCGYELPRSCGGTLALDGEDAARARQGPAMSPAPAPRVSHAARTMPEPEDPGAAAEQDLARPRVSSLAKSLHGLAEGATPGPFVEPAGALGSPAPAEEPIVARPVMAVAGVAPTIPGTEPIPATTRDGEGVVGRPPGPVASRGDPVPAGSKPLRVALGAGGALAGLAGVLASLAALACTFAPALAALRPFAAWGILLGASGLALVVASLLVAVGARRSALGFGIALGVHVASGAAAVLVDAFAVRGRFDAGAAAGMALVCASLAVPMVAVLVLLRVRATRELLVPGAPA